MTNVTFYSGMRTIGGTVIAIEHNKHRILFDFGYVVNNIFDNILKPRGHSLVTDALKLKALPQVEGIFSREDLRDHPLKSSEEDDRTSAFFISHMHLDHMASLGFIAPEIPIYVSPHSYSLFHALEIAGDQLAGRSPNLVKADFNEPFMLGEMEVTLLSIDHDVVGASGLKVRTPDGEVVYTGDYRFHGHYPEKLDRFIEAVKGTDVLITEGVTVSFVDQDRVLEPKKDNPEGAMTEYDLIGALSDVCRERSGLVMINFYDRNIHRIEFILDALKHMNRQMVLTPSTATIIKNYSGREDYLILGDGEGQISIDELNKAPGKYLLQVTYEQSMELLDMDLTDGVYIHSNGTPLGDYDPAYGRLLALLEALNLEFLPMPCGGHAHPDQLQYMIEAISPKVLVPYHSFAPERLSCPGSKQVLPEPYSVYQLVKGDLI